MVDSDGYFPAGSTFSGSSKTGWVLKETMGCESCIFLNNVKNHPEQKGAALEPCSRQYNCNPFFKDGHDRSVIITESFCATCQALDKECQCDGAARQIRVRGRQVASGRN